MTTTSYAGFTYDTETRQVTFTKQVCSGCKGEKKVTRNISCPLWDKPVRKYGGKCPHCGAKNSHSHKAIGEKIVTCYECKGTGETMPDMYTSLNFSDLIKDIQIKTFAGIHGASFNESYLGVGIIGGTTDYGAYLDKAQGDPAKLAQIVLESMQERNSSVQAGNLLDVDGKLIPVAYLKLNRSGWSVFSQGAYFQRNRE